MLCPSPKIKCGQCERSAFAPLDDQAVYDHLVGRHVIGVYALLQDETCWFLAIDFDKEGWADDVSAVRETCRRLEVPAYLERSRSGNGAHVWFFFGKPIPAHKARMLGSLVLTETMTNRPELSFSSYDRLFPSQDTMPSGGFGNLIALPLQGEPRRRGNSVFVDDNLEPFADQWGLLASVRRIHRAQVDLVLGARDGNTLDVQSLCSR